MSQILGCRQLVRRYAYDGDARYARVSTIGQDLDAQLAALDAAGVDPSRVFTDKLSGSAKTARPGSVALLDYARPGDTVVVAAIDRLGRSVAEVTRTIADLGERRITLHVLREGVDTATPTGRSIAAIMASLAELERELGRERRAASRESRRARHLPATKPLEAQPRTARTVFETLVRDFSATAIELHGKASSTEAQQVWALGAVRKPVIDEARAERIYAEVRALADSYVMPD